MKIRKISLLLSVCLLCVAACAPVATQSGAVEGEQPKPTAMPDAGGEDQLEGSESGVAGQVFIGPVCPVVSPGQDCDDRPFPARISVLTADAETVTAVETDAEGRFWIPLQPGVYTLRPETLDVTSAGTQAEGPSLPASEQFPYTEELQVTVVEGQYTQLTITFDSGIR